MPRTDVDPVLVERLGALCLALPGATEELAWRGTRWRIRGKTFAHVLELVDGRPESYVSAAGVDCPATVLTFRVTPADAELFARLGPPYWAIRWGRDVGGLVLSERPDWVEIAELVTDSYCLMAPQKLAARVRGPG